MSSKFLNWVNDDAVSNNVETYSEFSSDTERSGGFQSGTPASAKKVNTALRQANLVAAAIMNIADPNGTLDVQSSLTNVQTSVQNSFIGKKINTNTYTGVKSTQGNITIQIPVATAANPNTPADFFLEAGKHYLFKGYFSFEDIDTTAFVDYGVPYTDVEYPFAVDIRTNFADPRQQANQTMTTMKRCVSGTNYVTEKGFIFYPASADNTKNYCQDSTNAIDVTTIGAYHIGTDRQRISGDSSDYYVVKYYFSVMYDRKSSGFGDTNPFPQNTKFVLTDVIELPL